MGQKMIYDFERGCERHLFACTIISGRLYRLRFYLRDPFYMFWFVREKETIISVENFGFLSLFSFNVF